MSVGKEIGKATWENYKVPFFKWLERKTKEGAKRYTFLGKTRDAWMQLDWGYAAQEYLKYIYEFHSQFQVFGIERAVKLDELSTDVFVFKKSEFTDPSQKKDDEKIGGLKLVFQDKRGKKLFIWGEPGAGKTTFLKQILAYSIEKTDLIPLFISVAEWNITYPLTKEGLLSYLSGYFERCKIDNVTVFLEYIIEEGKALLLFDGLDEISNEGQKSIIVWLEQNQNSSSQIAVTCRVDAIAGQINSYTEVKIARWDERRVHDFIEKRLPNKATQRKFLSELNDIDKKSLNDFRKNPLLLSLLCSTFVPEKGFPEKRSEIYFEATRHLLHKRDQEKRISREPIAADLTIEQLEILYSHVAYNSFIEEKFYFTEQELEKRISAALTYIQAQDNIKKADNALLLPQLVSQHGILARRGYNTYTFSHLTFQEYYTARYISDNTEKGTLEFLAKHVSDQRWREVFLLTAGIL